MQVRAVKSAEKLNAMFQLGEKKLLASLPEATKWRIEQIFPNARFFKVGLGNMSKKLYLCIFGWFAVYGTYLCNMYLIKHINKVNVTM